MTNLLNGHEYIAPCPICGQVKVPGCDHRTKGDMGKIRLSRKQRRDSYNNNCIAQGRPDLCHRLQTENEYEGD